MKARQLLAAAILMAYTPVLAGPVGMATSSGGALQVAPAAEPGQMFYVENSTLLGVGDVLTTEDGAATFSLMTGTSCLLGPATTVAIGADAIDLRVGSLAMSGTQLSPVTSQDLVIEPLPVDGRYGTVNLGVRSGEGVTAVFTEGISAAVVVSSTGERVATLGHSDQLVFTRGADGAWGVTPVIFQEQQNIPDPSMPEEDDESRKGFFWRFWTASVGGTVASVAAVGAAAAIVVVGGGVVVNDQVLSDDDDSESGGSDDPEFTPPPVSPMGG